METAAKGALDAILTKETWSAEDYKDLLKQLFDTNDAPRKFRTMVNEMENASPDAKGSAALKIGIARYMVCRFDEALQAFANATDNKERRYFQAMCYKCLKQFDKAVEDLECAKDKGWEGGEIDLQIAESKALAGDLEGAAKAIAKLEKLSSTAWYHYVRGLIDELLGYPERAMESYVKARQIDPAHVEATFHLAYFHDLHGEEDQAIELYRECLTHPPVRANTLLNLAILYEDVGRFDLATGCLKRVLATNPSHPRARLFLKDADASRTMFYDEDQAKRVARRNAVLDIPVTDFELSVRARNCLKKMSVRTLGDLVRTTESDLLAYKNFGETSLKEIKDMLSIKGLRLGQAVEEEGGVEAPPKDLLSMTTAPAAAAQASDESVMATPIANIDFSIRARKALENLKVTTLGDLAQKSEADLMNCKNFGQTSLNEITQRLSEYGLRLKDNA